LLRPRIVGSRGGDIIYRDVIVLVLLQHLHIAKRAFAAMEALDKPGAMVRPVPENRR